MALVENKQKEKIEFKRFKLYSPYIKGENSELSISFPKTTFGEKKLNAWKTLISKINQKLGAEALKIEEIPQVDYDNVEFDVDL